MLRTQTELKIFLILNNLVEVGKFADFKLLVKTGLPLKHPDQNWASPKMYTFVSII